MHQHASFLALPPELRLSIYDIYLADHTQVLVQRTQPSNRHLRLLRVCSTIYHEARDLLQGYASLRNEREIVSFIQRATPEHAVRVRWTDLAHDARIVQQPSKPTVPVSQVANALDKMLSLRTLRVFDCIQAVQISLNRFGLRLTTDFEGVLWPSGASRLTSYKLFLAPDSPVNAFHILDPQYLIDLRLSGHCSLNCGPNHRMPSLRHLSLVGIKGNYFDLHSLDACFADSNLKSFSYSQCDRLAFELRDPMLKTIVATIGSGLERLVLLGCNRVTSLALGACLQDLPMLRYFACTLTTVHELSRNFILDLSTSLMVLKLEITNAWYQVPKIDEEREISEAIELTLLDRAIRKCSVSTCVAALWKKTTEGTDGWRSHEGDIFGCHLMHGSNTRLCSWLVALCQLYVRLFKFTAHSALV